MCWDEKGDLQHITLHCPAYQDERRKHPSLQYSTQEDEDQVIKKNKFENENTNVENKKEPITTF